MSTPLQPLSLRHDLGDRIKERYTVRQVLGAGAFGTVYRIEETLGSRTVTRACKEMHVLDDPETALDERADALRMFQEEAYLMETLRHPNIPAAHFEIDEGTWLACPVCGRSFKGVRDCPDHGARLQVVKKRYYLLMDFIEGPDLEEMLLSQNGRPLDEEPVLDWMLQVCDALETVHRAGFSHRDIKPANIKIQSATQRAMLIDFGLVKPSAQAGAYGTVLQRKSTALGTLGYAPPSLEEQRSPDARTDILALGMTMYRLLTGRDPTLPSDLEAMRKTSPREFNASISPEVSGIIARMIAPDPAKRYANVDEVRVALQAARYPVVTPCPHCGFLNRADHSPDAKAVCKQCGRSLADAKGAPAAGAKGGTTVLENAPRAAPPQPVANPYGPRLRELRDEMRAPLPVAPSRFDARIADIEKTLATVTPLATGVPLDGCPNCQKATLRQADGNPTGACPLCRRAQLQRRPLDANKCPCCHALTLKRGLLPSRELFCPVCREVPLREDVHSRMMGVVADMWWKCPHCEAEWDEGRHRSATLKEAPQDPWGVASQLKDKTLPFEEWRPMSGRHNEYIACGNCSANWDVPAPDAATLLHAGQNGEGEAFKGQTRGVEGWQKLAEGLPPDAGTHHCPSCSAEFDVERAQGAMTLLRAGTARPAWAQGWEGTPHALREWYLASDGKSSGRAGLLCPQCGSEWDAAGDGFRLVVAKPGPLIKDVGDTHTLEDWQRLARGAPSREEAAALRRELGGLQEGRRQEQQFARRDAEARRQGTERELAELLKTAVLEGHIPLQRLSGRGAVTQTGMFVALASHLPHTALRAGEMLRWEGLSTHCRAQVMSGGWGWMREATGTLMVSSERVLFVSAASDPRGAPQTWHRATARLEAVEAQNVQGSQVVAVRFEGEALPWGFELADALWPLHWDGEIYQLLFSPQDLIAVLQGL